MGSWKIIRIGELCDEHGGLVQTGPFGSQLHASDYVDEGIPVVMPVNIGRNTVNPIGIARVNEADHARLAKYQLRSGDIVYSRRGDIGRHAYVTSNEEGWLCGTGCLFIRFNNPEVDPRYVSYFLDLPESIDYVFANAVGTTMPNLNTEILRSVPIRLPEYSVQVKIADILCALDDKIELNRRMNETLEQMAMALYKHWFVDFGPFQDGEFLESEEFGQIPACFNVTSIGSEVKVLGGGTPSTKVNEYWANGTINWFSPTDLTASRSVFITKSAKGITEKGLNESSAKLFPPYSVMMTSRATIGVIAINREPASTNQGFIVLVPNEKFPASYLFLWLKSNMEKIRSISNGSTFLEVNRSNFKALPIFESEKVIEFGARIDPFFSQIESLTIETETLTETRDYLLPRLLSGEIEVKAAEEQVEEVLAGG